ncbi:hypothetical protein BBF96_12620 [Anoxybacter fermentans]|uniref:Uncharacterized protein n=1 Tax=Anoxybacter fermentans TaxID=1323375 RepID=A0A3Q9HRL3_9FIRM|nr:hypothetical protein BBF96_12620 [Anoxybacter fermentans]
MYSDSTIKTPFYGEKVYHLIPELLSNLDPTRLYWPSSPYVGRDIQEFQKILKIILQKANFERHRNFSPNHLSKISDEIRPNHRM